MDLTKSLSSYDPVEGKVDIRQWMDKIDEYAEMYEWDDLANKHYALSKLEEVAKSLNDSLEKGKQNVVGLEGIDENIPSRRYHSEKNTGCLKL